MNKPLLAISVLLLCQLAPAGQVLYSYRADGTGGLARVSINDQTGEITAHERLLESVRLADAHKIAIDSERNLAVIVNESEESPVAWIVPLNPGSSPPSEVILPSMPDAVCISAGVAHISLDNGAIVAIDLDSRSIVASFNPRRELTPPAHKPESFHDARSRGLILVSFQKDSRNGRREGSRILVLRERSLELVADVRLPRTMPELHNPQSNREQGPSPEVIVVCEATGAVLITIDFYGALLPVKLNHLMDGHIGQSNYHSTSLDGSFGHAFPDRLVTLAPEASHRVVVLNSGQAGGGVLMDYSTGEILSRFELPHGLEPVLPIISSEGVATVFAAHAGKLKVRAEPEVKRTFHPRAQLTEITIKGDTVSVHHHPAPEVTHIASKADAAGRYLLVVQGEQRTALGRFNTAELTFLEKSDQAFGSVERMLMVP